MSRKKITIGIFGFGCVGTGLYEVLERTPGLKTQIKKICVKNRNKPRSLPEEYFTYDKKDLLNDPDIDVIVELIDDPEAAFAIVSTALKNGKAVVSANKKMIAEHFNELLFLQRKHNVPLLYEAACCASIPIIRNLEEYYDNDLLESIEGIVNGSTNYILSKIDEEHISYATALREAQEKGFAESDPLLDTGGFDAKYKLLILIAHAFGVVGEPDAIFNLGIDKLGASEFKYAKEKGLKIKLVAQAERTANGKIRAHVFPKFVSPTDRLYSVNQVFNGIKTRSCFSDVQFFEGKGAGAHPTASAVLSDLSALTYNYRYEYRKVGSPGNFEEDEDVLLKVLWRCEKNEAGNAGYYFKSVEETHVNSTERIVVGYLTLGGLKKILGLCPKSSFVLFKSTNEHIPLSSFDLAELEAVLG